MRLSKRSVLIFTAVASGLAVLGCGGKNPTTVYEGHAQTKLFIGTWTENRDALKGYWSTAVSADIPLHKIEIKDDGNFRLSFVDKSGAAVKADQFVEGTWVIEGVKVRLTATNNKLPADAMSDTPTLIKRIVKTGDTEEAKSDQIQVQYDEAKARWFIRS